MVRIGILVSGRGSNMVSIIKACSEGRIDGEVVTVISDNLDAPALAKAHSLGVEAVYIDPSPGKVVLKGEGETRYIEHLLSRNVDLVCLAGFMRIIKYGFLNQFKGRIMNIHPSLLPSFPGLEAQKQAVDYGVRFSGCTVHFVDESVDEGPIILQAVVPVFQNDTPESLAERILKEEHRIYPEAIQLFAHGKLEIKGRKVFIKEDAWKR